MREDHRSFELTLLGGQPIVDLPRCVLGQPFCVEAASDVAYGVQSGHDRLTGRMQVAGFKGRQRLARKIGDHRQPSLEPGGRARPGESSKSLN